MSCGGAGKRGGGKGWRETRLKRKGKKEGVVGVVGVVDCEWTRGVGGGMRCSYIIDRTDAASLLFLSSLAALSSPACKLCQDWFYISSIEPKRPRSCSFLPRSLAAALGAHLLARLLLLLLVGPSCEPSLARLLLILLLFLLERLPRLHLPGALLALGLSVREVLHVTDVLLLNLSYS